jgi:hypothetical protein
MPSDRPRPTKSGELGDEAREVRIKDGGVGVHDLLGGPPADAVELAVIMTDDVRRGRGQHEPEADIGVTARASGASDGQEGRLPVETGCRSRLKKQFLGGLALHREPGVLADLDVTTGRQPESRPAVVDQEQRRAVRIDHREVRDQMLVGNIRASTAEDVVRLREPGQGVEAVLGLEFVTAAELFDRVPNVRHAQPDSARFRRHLLSA